MSLAAGTTTALPMRALIAALLAFAVPATAQPGWVTSRANCHNNESFTWRPGTSELRRTASRHIDYVFGRSHTAYSPHWPAYVDTWRSAAIHWLEGRPTQLGFEYVLTYVPCYDNGLGERRYCWERRRVPRYIYDRWRVKGTHNERIGSVTTTRYTDTTDCCVACI